MKSLLHTDKTFTGDQELTTEEFLAGIWFVLSYLKILDLHSHLFDQKMEEAGADEHARLLYDPISAFCYHYLLREFFGHRPDLIQVFNRLSPEEQARMVFEELYVRREPCSEATIGLQYAYARLGVTDFSSFDRILEQVRNLPTGNDLLRKVFDLAGIRQTVMTNNVFSASEVPHYKNGVGFDRDLLLPALRLDPLILNPKSAVPFIQARGFRGMSADPTDRNAALARKFVDGWAKHFDPKYMAVSVDKSFDLNGPGGFFLREAIVPSAIDAGLPLFIMCEVERQQNPNTGLAGDGLDGQIDIETIKQILRLNQNADFWMTSLDEGTAKTLTKLMATFENLIHWGGWWYAAYADSIGEIGAARMQLTGTRAWPYHTDGRHAVHAIYKLHFFWKAYAPVLLNALETKQAAGTKITVKVIERLIKELFDEARLTRRR